MPIYCQSNQNIDHQHKNKDSSIVMVDEGDEKCDDDDDVLLHVYFLLQIVYYWTVCRYM